MKRKAEIIFETEELVAVKARRVFKGFCASCDAFVEMLPVEAAAALTGMSEREIFRLIEVGEIHFVENERVLVCRDSSMNRSKVLPGMSDDDEMIAVNKRQTKKTSENK